MFCARAAWIAPLRRAFIAGSGRPILAAAVISRASLEKSLERFLSWAPLRNWMFLNFEWPAMASHPFAAVNARPRLIGAQAGKIQSVGRAVGPTLNRRDRRFYRSFSEALTLTARQIEAWRLAPREARPCRQEG